MLTLHTYFRSSASYRVRIALELKSLTYESIPVHLVRGGGDQHSAAFAALNPAELVPVLSHDGLTITQSLAIIEYLEEIRPTPSLLPGDAASRARIRSIAQLIACEVHPLNNLRGTSAARVQCWHGRGRPRSLVCTPTRRCNASTTPACNCRHFGAPRRTSKPTRLDYKGDTQC